ncbi:MAG: TetR/AcrR family transcriptional regulator [Chloroflexi bacterium]|nr:TetR/AcrR family transcriptional regulator [Chloroflexota bacterium]
MPKGIPRTNAELDERRREIAHTAANLIFEKGFNETSVNQIAKAAGIGKSTLYDFFPNKDEIILYLMAEYLEEVTRNARAIIAGGGSVAERLYQVMHTHLEILMRDKAMILKLSLEAQRLSLESQQRYQMLRHAYQDMVIGLIDEGLADGSFRAVDSAIAMKTLFSMMSSLVFTTRPVGTPQEMLDKALDLILNGLRY